MPRTKKLTEQIERVAKKKVKEKQYKTIFSYGNTLLNLVCADNPKAGGAGGTFVNIVGDKSTGKTFLGLTALAEASINPTFDNYELIHDNAEGINLFDMDYLFGSNSDRIKGPEDEEGNQTYSKTVQDLQHNLFTALEKGPCIYVLDSFDSLTEDKELEKFKKQARAKRKKKVVADIEEGEEPKKEVKPKGSYGMGKAKASSEMFRNLYSMIEETNSWLIIISQTREQISFSFEKYTRNGGKALDFYAANIIWLTHTKTLYKTVNKIKRSIGCDITATCRKNKITGKSRACSFSIYYDYGIDSIGSCVDFLIKAGTIKKRKSILISEELEFEGSKSKIISHIEDNDLEEVLFELTGEVWNDIEDSVKLNRKKKYE